MWLHAAQPTSMRGIHEPITVAQRGTFTSDDGAVFWSDGLTRGCCLAALTHFSPGLPRVGAERGQPNLSCVVLLGLCVPQKSSASQHQTRIGALPRSLWTVGYKHRRTLRRGLEDAAISRLLVEAPKVAGLSAQS